MANRYGYMTTVLHKLNLKGKTEPISDSFPLPVSTSGVTNAGNVVSTLNSTTTPLGAGATFTGTGEDVINYTSINITILSDVPSAEAGLQFQFSTDNVSWITSDAYSYIDGGIRKTYSIQRLGKYFRIVYENGVIGQSTVNLNVIYNISGAVTSSHRIGDIIDNEDDAQLSKAVLSAQSPIGRQINILGTNEGELRTSVTNPIGSLPVSQLTTLHDGKIVNRLFPNINEIVGTGTGTHQTNKYNMAVTSGQWHIFHTRRFYPYYAGKPQKIEETFDSFHPEESVVKRVGYFSSNTSSPYDTTYDGIYLESSNDNIRFIVMRSGTEVLNAPMEDWFGYEFLGDYQDPANWENFTVIEFNFIWLGGAYLELRVTTQNGQILAHRYIHSGTATDVMFTQPNQTVRYEIRSTTGSGSLRYICSHVATLGGAVYQYGIGNGISTGTPNVTLSSSGTKYPILAIRKQTALRQNPVQIKAANLLVSSSDNVLWTLEINPTLSAGLTYSPISNSAIESAIGDKPIMNATASSSKFVFSILSHPCISTVLAI